MASFMQKSTNDGAISHGGDDTTGEGKGDDEVIKVNLTRISSNCQTMWPVITIYTAGHQFDDVSNAYVRILDPKSRSEICRFNLSNNKDGVSTGNIVGCIKRNGDTWTFKSLGYYVKNADTCDDVIPRIKEIMQNNLKNVIILKQKKGVENPSSGCCSIF